MNNYFARQKVCWNNFTPNDIYFKRNILAKKANVHNEVNIISYNSKGAFMNEYDTGVFVHIKDIKQEFPTAHINVLNKGNKNNGQWMNNLYYLNSRHNRYEWVKDPNSQYGWASKKVNKAPLPDAEGYTFELGGTCSMGLPAEMQEQIDILHAIHNFFIERVLPAKRGTLVNNALTMVA